MWALCCSLVGKYLYRRPQYEIPKIVKTSNLNNILIFKYNSSPFTSMHIRILEYIEDFLLIVFSVNRIYSFPVSEQIEMMWQVLADLP
jgi:hypothetical protein